MAGGVFSTAKVFGITIRESANDGSDFTNPDADYRRLFLGEDGLIHSKDSAGTVADIGAHGAWTDYTPSWTADGTAPAIGNGTLTGRYKSLDSKTYIIEVSFAAGSTTTFGTQQWHFSLPAGLTANKDWALAGVALDSGTIWRPVNGRVASGGTRFETLVSDAGGVTNLIPWTWANGDQMVVSGIIEVT